MPDLRARTTVSGGASSMGNAIRSMASPPRTSSVSSRDCLEASQYPRQSHASVSTSTSKSAGRVAMVCAGSLQVRSYKLLWKPAIFQLVVATSDGKEELQDDSDDESYDDFDLDHADKKPRSPIKTHHYSLVWCQRSLLGHARRERIDLDDPREPVELIWGDDGLMSTRFEFSIMHGRVGASGRRRTLTCRARDAKEYLQWTGALRMAVERVGKHIKGGDKHNRSTHARTLASSEAPSQNRGSIDSFFDLEAVEEQQQLRELEESSLSASSRATAAAEALALLEADLEQSGQHPMATAGRGSTFIMPSTTHRSVSAVVKPGTPASEFATPKQRRKRSVSSSGIVVKPTCAPQVRRAVSYSPTSPTASTAATAIAPPEADIAAESALKPVPAEVAGVQFTVPTPQRQRPESIRINKNHSITTLRAHLHRRKRSVSSAGAARRGATCVAVKVASSSRRRARKRSVSSVAMTGIRRGSVAMTGAADVDEQKPRMPTKATPRRRKSQHVVSMPRTTRQRKLSVTVSGKRTVRSKKMAVNTNSGSKRNRVPMPSPVASEPEEKKSRTDVVLAQLHDTPPNSVPMLGAMAMLDAPSSLEDSPLDLIDAYEITRTTEYVASLVEIAGVASTRQRQQLLQRQRQASQDLRRESFGLHVIPRGSRESASTFPRESDDHWVLSRRGSVLDLDSGDVAGPDLDEDEAPRRSYWRGRRPGESWKAYLNAMEVEF